jgi:hypothetical protein
VILVPNVERQIQLLLFGAVLARLRGIGELVNKALGGELQW